MSRRPNVVVVVSDDHGYADRSALGLHDDIATPALDRLAAEGVSCTEAYVTAPICSASRAALVSGRYQARWGARWFDDSAFPPDGPVVAEQLRAAGYATGYFGKVHYGRETVGDRACPPHHGFGTSFYGLAGQQQGRLNYLRHSRRAVDDYGPEASWRMAVQPMLDGDDEVEFEGFLTKELGRRARAFVERHRDEPFLCMVAFNAVHNFCWQLPPEELAARGLPPVDDWRDAAGPYAEWYDGAITPHLPHGRDYYRAQLELMDAQVGLLLAELDRLGLADDTLVLYLTDNGGSTCNYGDNTPLRGTKYTLWEGGVRVPFLLRWPGGGVPAGLERDGLVSALDVVPTILAATGVDSRPADYDGRDLLPVVRDDAPGHEALHWDCGFQWAVRRGRHKLVSVDGDHPKAVGVRRVEHAEPGDGTWLTDLVDDPAESRNLAAERPDLLAELAREHTAWRARVGLVT